MLEVAVKVPRATDRARGAARKRGLNLAGAKAATGEAGADVRTAIIAKIARGVDRPLPAQAGAGVGAKVGRGHGRAVTEDHFPFLAVVKAAVAAADRAAVKIGTGSGERKRNTERKNGRKNIARKSPNGGKGAKNIRKEKKSTNGKKSRREMKALPLTLAHHQMTVIRMSVGVLYQGRRSRCISIKMQTT